MTNEELEKTMQFILEQQAQFAANQQQTDERVSRLETNMAELTRDMSEMARTQTHMNEVVAVMVETHRHTEEKLDAFIGVLERYISEDRNGKNGAEDAT
jgi:cupin superfamily acireductone dioxygenase involved in methionine salvage